MTIIIILLIVRLRHICIYGPIVTEAIWEEYHCKYIDIKMMEKDMGIEDNNIFTDLKTLEHRNLYHQFNTWFFYDSDKSVIINNIRLYIISDDHYYDNFTPIFLNQITDDWHLTIKDLKGVMNKIEKESNCYYNTSHGRIFDTWFIHDKTQEKLSETYHIKVIKNID